MTEAEAATLLDTIYAAATAPSLWPAALEGFADAVGGSGVWLSRLNVADGTGSGLIVRIDPAMPQRYLDHFAARNPFANARDPDRYLRHWKADVRLQDEWIARDALLATEYYNDFLLPQDIHSSMMVQLLAQGRDTVVINLNRTHAAGGFERRHVDLARRFRPHFERAFALTQRWAGADARDGDIGQILDAIDDAVFVVRSDGRIVHANPPARDFGDHRPGLRVVHGRLQARDAGVARQLERLIGAATARTGSARTGGTMTVGQTGVALKTIPIGLTGEVFGGEPQAIVVVTAPPAPRLAGERFRARYGLTAAELRVALALAGGASPREAAETFGVSFHTIRNQLQRLYSKTDTRRQSKLVLLLAQMGDPVPTQP